MAERGGPVVRRFWLVPIVIAIAMVSAAFAGQSSTKSELRSALQRSFDLLERKQYVEFFKTSIRPDELEELVARFGSVESVAAEYGRTQRPATLMAAIDAALAIEPVFNADGTIATYRFAAPIRGERRLSLVKIDGRWYLRN